MHVLHCLICSWYVRCGKYIDMWLICMWLNLFPLCLVDDFVVVFVAPKISVSCRPLDSTVSLLSRGQVCFLLHILIIKRLRVSLLFLHATVVYFNVGRVTKPMRHSFWTDMSHMCHACEMWRSRIIPFLDNLRVDERAWYCNEPRVRTRFWYHSHVVLRCTIVGRAIGEQRGYAIEISFRLVARHKSMLCRPHLGGLRTYPFL
jgi:hypothetical protein